MKFKSIKIPNQNKKSSLLTEELLDYNKNRKAGADNIFCYAPSTSMHFDIYGEVMLCCMNRVDTLGNVKNKSLHNLWFSDKRDYIVNKINKEFKLNEGCESCLIGIKSKNYSSVVAQNYDFHSKKKHNKYPTRLEFEISNKCNLECVMCNGDYSHLIRNNREGRSSIEMIYNDYFLTQLKEFIPHLKYADFIGGEPMLIPIYQKIWDMIFEYNKNCLIHIQTNCTVLTNKQKTFINKGNVEIGLSIDSLDKLTAEKIRQNINWENFTQNLDYYVNLYHSNKINLTINHCPMPINRNCTIQVLEFANKNNISIFFCNVYAPYEHSYMSSEMEFIEDTINLLNYYYNKNYNSKNNYIIKNNFNQLKSLANFLKDVKKNITEMVLFEKKYDESNVEDLIQLLRIKNLEIINDIELSNKIVNTTLKFLEEYDIKFRIHILTIFYFNSYQNLNFKNNNEETIHFVKYNLYRVINHEYPKYIFNE